MSFVCKFGIALILCVRCSPSEAADFYVAPDGNDSHFGTRAEVKGDDGPFASLDRAVKAVRKLRREQPDRNTPIVVQLRGGLYYPGATLRFTADDSGTADSPLVIEAFPGETPVLSGGRRLVGWEKSKDARWNLTVPEVAEGKWRFSQLYVNDQRRFRPSLPREGYFFIEAPVGGTRTWSQDRFRFKSDDLKAAWRNLNDVELIAFHKWSISRIPIKSIDEDRRICDLAGSTWHAKISPLNRETWYRVDNVCEALREPGQWYLDRPSGVLTYLPLPGEAPDQVKAVAPLVSQIVSLRGNAEPGRFVEHIVLRGLTFAHTGWNVPAKGYSAFQAEKAIDGVITINNARHCRIEDCIVRQTANYAVQIGVGCRDVAVEGCEFYDLGAGGVRVGSDRFNDEPDKSKWTSHCTIRDNLVAHGGRVHPGAVGIWIAHAHDCTADHNHIHDLYYSGMSIGWRWATGPSPATNNTIAYNRIHDIGRGVLSDMAGIYTLGLSPGTTVRHNRIDNVRRARYGGWGIYCDANSGKVLVENNIVSNTEDGGFHQHYGTDNVVRNNIFAFGKRNQIQLTKAKESGRTTIEGNIWCWREGALFKGKLDDEMLFARNLYWKQDGEPFEFPLAKSVQQWRQREEGFVIADPRFADARQGDFTLGANSPAAKIGFRPIDLSRCGRLTKTRRTASLPEVPRAFAPATEPPPVVMEEDFEALRADRSLPGWGQMAASREENVRVVDELAAGGKQCLKFNDGPGGAVYFPHLFRNIKYESGTIVTSFDVRLEPGAHMQFEWRDDTPWYTRGPSVEIGPDGGFTASRKKLTTVPHNAWINVKMVCTVGPDAKGVYDVEVTLPGQSEPRRFTDIEYQEGFETVGWFGFCCLAKKRVAYYVDNLTIKPLR